MSELSAPPANPYVGPQSFRAEDEQRFFGRDRETRELFSLIVAERVVLMHSPSGAGKTSLLQAALIPRLGRAEFSVRPVIRVNTAPGIPGANRYALSAMLSLEKELPVAAQIPEHELAGLTLSDYLQRRPPADAGAGDVLIFDQFEEVLTLDPTDVDAKAAFFTQLGEALREQRGRPRRWALFAMREEFMGALAPYVRLVPTQFVNTYRLGLLGLDGARQAIQRPAAQAGVTIANDAAQHLVRDLARVVVQRADGAPEARDGLSVEPVQLQVVCTRLWEESLGAGGYVRATREPPQPDTYERLASRPNQGHGDSDPQRNLPLSPSERSVGPQRAAATRSERVPVSASAASGPLQGSITLADVQHIGDVSTALADYYSLKVGQVAGQSGVAERAIREWFSEQLITPQGIRGQVLQGAEESQAVAPAIRDLQDAYLVRAEPRQGRTWFELAHDRLIDPVRTNNLAWFEEHLSDLQRQAKLWDRSGRPDGLLLLEDELRHAIQVILVGPDLSKVEQEFLDECNKAQHEVDTRRAQLERERAQARRIRNLAIAAGIVSVVATIAFIGALIFRNQAVANEQKANENARIANENAQIAQANELRANENAQIAQANELRAEQSAREARARELAAAALVTLNSDPELSILLGLSAAEATLPDDPPVPEVADALQQAVQTSRMRQTLVLTDALSTVSYSPDGTRLAIATNNTFASVWDVASGTKLFELPGTSSFASIAYSPDGSQIAMASFDGAIYLWDAADGRPISLPATFTHPDASAIAFSPDGARFATSGFDDYVRVWDLRQGTVQELPFDDDVSRLTFDPNNPSRLAVALTNQLVEVRDLRDGSVVESLTIPSTPSGIAFSPDSARLAIAGTDGNAYIRTLGDGAPPLVLRGHTNLINRLSFSPDGRTLATASNDTTVRVWNLDTGLPLLILSGHRGSVNDVAFSPDGAYLATAGEDQTARIWSLQQARLRPLETVGVSPDTALIAAAGDENTIYLWDSVSGDLKQTLSDGHSAPVTAVAFSSDGTRLVSGSDDRSLVIWDLATGTIADQLPEASPAPLIRAIPFADGQRVAAAGFRANLLIWDLRATQVITFTDPWGGPNIGGQITGLDLSPDERYLAAGNTRAMVRIWDLETNQLSASLDMPTRIPRLSDLAYLDAQRLVISFEDGTLLFWEPATGGQTPFPDRHAGTITRIALSPDGSLIATSSLDRSVRIWDAATGELRQTLTHPNQVLSVAFLTTPQGLSVVSAGSDGVVRVLPLDLAALRALAETRVKRLLTPAECRLYRLTTRCATP